MNRDQPSICITCGTRYSPEKYNSATCPVCEDDRQYVHPDGQQWTSFDQLARQHSVAIQKHRSGLHDLRVTPKFGIGQRAFFIESSAGNVMWDCISLIDETSVEFIQSRGGLSAIAISHPHYYSLMVQWARQFDCPIYLHEKDREWVMDDEPAIVFWKGDHQRLAGSLSIVHVGGHFPGSTILHDAETSTVFVGDSLQLAPSKRHLSVMYSFPNYIPLSAADTMSVFSKSAPLRFDALFGAFPQQNLHAGARAVFDQSVKRYKSIFGKET